MTCVNGETIIESAVFPRGDHINPVSWEEIRDKAKRSLPVRFDDNDAARVLAAVDGYVGGGDIGVLSDALRAPPRAEESSPT